MWLLGLEELLHDLSRQNEENQYGRQIHPWSFESSLNIYFGKQTVNGWKRILQKSQK